MRSPSKWALTYWVMKMVLGLCEICHKVMYVVDKILHRIGGLIESRLEGCLVVEPYGGFQDWCAYSGS